MCRLWKMMLCPNGMSELDLATTLVEPESNRIISVRFRFHKNVEPGIGTEPDGTSSNFFLIILKNRN